MKLKDCLSLAAAATLEAFRMQASPTTDNPSTPELRGRGRVKEPKRKLSSGDTIRRHRKHNEKKGRCGRRIVDGRIPWG